MQPKGEGECRSTMVLPAVVHLLVEGTYRSEFGAFFTSMVRMEPSGNRVQPSSALKSLLPPPGSTVHASVLGLRIAMLLVSLFPTTKVPLGKTADGESPMYFQTAGAGRFVQVFALGS